MKRIAVVAFLLAACSPSVTHEQLGPGQYAIDARGRSRHSTGELLKLMHRRAGELCPNGYDVVDSSSGSKPVVTNGAYGTTVSSRPEAGLIVRCR